MTTLVLISFIVFVAYNIVSLILFGVPKSLSETFYLYKEKYNCGWVFSVVLAVMAFTLMPAFIQISENNFYWYAFLSFFTCAFIVFVAVAPHFKSYESRIHTISALIAAFSGFLWCFLSIWIVPVLVIITMSFPIIGLWKTSKTYWLEMIAFFSVYYSVILSL